MAGLSTLAQLAHFTTDAAGLDRTFRMVQAAAAVILHCSLPQSLFLQLVSALSSSSSSSASPSGALEPAVIMTMVAQVDKRVDLARRFFRVFTFLACFNGAWTVMHPAPAADGGKGQQQKATSLERWLEASSRSFTGMYLLLETAIFPDMLGIPGLRVLSPALGQRLFVEGMRFWFLGLGCGVALGLARLLGTLTRTPLPPLPEEDAVQTGAEGQQQQEEKEEEKEKGTAVGEGEEGEEERSGSDKDWLRERDRLRRVTQQQRQRRRLWRRDVVARSKHIARRTVADLLDMAIPGSVVGWVPMGKGAVGIVMVVTSWLTGKEVWERCGADLAAKGR